MAGTNELISPKFLPYLVRYLKTMFFMYPLLIALWILCIDLQFPGSSYGIVILWIISDILVIIALAIVLFCGIRVLNVIRRGLISSATRAKLVRKITVGMFLQVSTNIFFLFIFLAYFYLQFKPTFSGKMLNMIDICYRIVLILGCISGFYFFHVESKKDDHLENGNDFQKMQPKSASGITSGLELTEH